MHDSGIGRDISDTSYGKGVQQVKKHKPRLSPVKSDTPMEMEIRDDWRQFFELPSAQERKRLEMVKKDFAEGKMKQKSLPPISYIAGDLPLLPGEAGLRLLHTVRVGEKVATERDSRHNVEAIPGKLSVHTRHEENGMSNFGIIQMQWTTGIPATKSTDSQLEQYHTQDNGARSHDPRAYLPHLHKYASTNRLKPTRSEEFALPHLTGSRSPDFEWEQPLPPPPAKESRLAIPQIKKEHDHYCKYYKLARKKMHMYTSTYRM